MYLASYVCMAYIHVATILSNYIAITLVLRSVAIILLFISISLCLENSYVAAYMLAIHYVSYIQECYTIGMSLTVAYDMPQAQDSVKPGLWTMDYGLWTMD